jgi:hypothetical protein
MSKKSVITASFYFLFPAWKESETKDFLNEDPTLALSSAHMQDIVRGRDLSTWIISIKAFTEIMERNN